MFCYTVHCEDWHIIIINKTSADALENNITIIHRGTTEV